MYVFMIEFSDTWKKKLYKNIYIIYTINRTKKRNDRKNMEGMAGNKQNKKNNLPRSYYVHLITYFTH